MEHLIGFISGVLSDASRYGPVAAITVFGMGAALLAASGFVFRVRAALNKPAWNGPTLPLLVAGVPISAVGLGLIYITYPS